MEKRFDTNDSVWIATAVMSYEIYHKKLNAGETIHVSDFSFVQSDILNRTLEINSQKAENARTSQWCCGDHPNHTYCYLRELPDKKRRLSFPGEFGGKEEPKNLKRDEIIKTSVGDITIQQLYDFVHTEYASFADQGINKTSIDYIAPLDYLDNHAREPYSGPGKQVSAEERKKIEELKKSAQNAVEQINKMMDLCEKRFKLKKAAQVKWLDGSNVKTKHYLWGQMKYTDHMESPISISIFVDLHAETKKARYRISLEIMNKDSDKTMMKQYHSYLDIDPDTEHGLVYGEGSNESDYVVILDEDRDVVKAKINNGTYDKVQYCRIVERDPSYKNDDYERLVMEGVHALIPYYEHVIGIKKDDYFPSKEVFDPGITKEQWIEFLEEDRKKYSNTLAMLKAMLDMGGEATCKALGVKLNVSPSACVSRGSNLGKRAKQWFNIEDYYDKNDERTYQFVIPFLGRRVDGLYAWKLRPELEEALKEMDLVNVEVETVMGSEFGLNTILYGPPGTGKTYNTARYAVAICDGVTLEEVNSMPYNDVLDRYKELKDKENRIVFTTFHQSYGYEEFIEGIKPNMNSEDDKLGYSIENGVFKDFCERAKAIKVHTDQGSKIKENPHIWGMILGGTGMTDLKRNCFENGEIRLGWSEVQDNEVDGEFFGDDKTSWNAKHMVADFKNSMEIGDIVVIEKTAKSIDAIGVITGEYEYDPSNTSYPRKRSVDWLLHDIDQSIVEFLPTGRKQMARFSLYDFNYLGMEAVSHILNSHTMAPVVEVEKEDKPYVFIIDEINRGNMSKIFGELITLIEETKRAGSSEAMEAILPYSGQPFSVPNNVYIIGTMNTADRSIALMDTALRRRFSFVEMMPNAEVLESLGVGTIEDKGVELNVAKMLEVINQRIEYLFDREHTIGHAFFTRLSDDPSINTLAEIFEKSVIPLLQEYFYEDYSKIQLVLGDNDKDDEYKFILDRPIKVKDIFKGNPDIDLPEKSYVIQKDAFYKLQSYKLIGKDL